MAKVLPEKPLDIFLSNFGNQERKFPKRMVFTYATKNELALLLIGKEVGREIDQYLHISEACEGGKEGEKRPEEATEENEPTSAQDWDQSVYLSHVEGSDPEDVEEILRYVERSLTEVVSN